MLCRLQSCCPLIQGWQNFTRVQNISAHQPTRLRDVISFETTPPLHGARFACLPLAFTDPLPVRKRPPQRDVVGILKIRPHRDAQG